MIELRELTPQDWALWRELRLAALAESPHAFGSRLADWRDAGDDRWRARLALVGSVNLVALLDGVPVGMASGVPGDGDRTVELISMWVAPAGRGRGVGDALVNAVESGARRASATTVELAVRVANAPAIALYARHGFTDTGRTPADDATEKIMAKSL
ncbi:GNAT family N-acetyltransferase [Micromonospora mirobrigensis]|uniref:Ribosomal protein S18 acetylase RimI n=1 Tax=Micromonospora mirobrigensis TaxID=262898 RepID=A0A1C5AQJ8_9ACTN|nr:GNAT family N-acetyltransferase [Micromonospora mirobrigensis]SCF47284.1 Ribosomal protein S18 acetylase RimI [Micromonospora mirobrigensis]